MKESMTEPKTQLMTDKQHRILKFVLDRKSVTAKVVAKQFLIAQATASTHLRNLHEAGYVTREQLGTHVVWTKTGEVPQIPPEVSAPVPVAVSDDDIVVQPSRPTSSELPKPIWPDNPFNKTSYPHVRGYDD